MSRLGNWAVRATGYGASVPTVLRIGPYRFFFWSNESSEPPHVHVEAGDAHAKIWLAPVRLEKNDGYNPRALRRLHELTAHYLEVSLADGRTVRVPFAWFPRLSPWSRTPTGSLRASSSCR